MKKCLTWWGAGGLFLLTALPALAASAPQNNALDSIVDKFKDQTVTWEPVIHNLTLSLFWGLVTISFTWCFIQLALKEGTGLVDVLAELTRRTLLIGFSIWMMNEAPDLARTLINSFIKVGTTISGGAVAFSPSNVFELGTNIITIVWDTTTMWKPVQGLAMIICALIIMICFAIMAMEMTILIVSGYIIVSGGIIAMGFLGSEWTRDNAINYFTAVLGVAFKMFVMQLIFIIGYSFIQDWGASIDSTSSTIDYMILLGSCIVFAGLMREIPQIAASLASGSFTMRGGGVQTAGTAVAAGAAGAMLLAGGGLMAGINSMTGGGGGNSEGDTGAGGSGSSSPSPHSMDTGPGDDGAGFAQKMQAEAASSGGDGTGAGGSSPQASGASSFADAQTTDTGPGDDGRGFAEKQQAEQPAAAADESASDDTDAGENSGGASQAGQQSGGQTATAASGSAAPTGTETSKPSRAAGVRGAAKSTLRMGRAATSATLHAVASRTAFGRMLSVGAKRLGEKPVDPTTASAEDVHRQLTAALNTASPSAAPSTTGAGNAATFDNNITSAENQHVYDEEKERREQRHEARRDDADTE